MLLLDKVLEQAAQEEAARADEEPALDEKPVLDAEANATAVTLDKRHMLAAEQFRVTCGSEALCQQHSGASRRLGGASRRRFRMIMQQHEIVWASACISALTLEVTKPWLDELDIESLVAGMDFEEMAKDMFASGCIVEEPDAAQEAWTVCNVVFVRPSPSPFVSRGFYQILMRILTIAEVSK